MNTTIITSKGTTTIPKEVRDLLSLHPGSRINFVLEGGRVRIERALTLDEVRLNNKKHTESVGKIPAGADLKNLVEKAKTDDLQEKYKL